MLCTLFLSRAHTHAPPPRTDVINKPMVGHPTWELYFTPGISPQIYLSRTDITLPHRCQSSQRSNESMSALINNPSFMHSLKPMNVQPWVSPPKIPPTKTTIRNKQYSLASYNWVSCWKSSQLFFASNEHSEIVICFWLKMCIVLKAIAIPEK